MKFTNVIDNEGRFVRLKVNLEKGSCQEDSHTFSYLFVRRELEKEYGTGIGLGKKS
ncbi:MAG: hypothetical protein KKF48_00750 [Nanoarchaeota archaeon]|nr:hypothetical protein [Nanoarchaeota archaeon]MBU1027552.1 hypothetical protein [Nanoarchaeota archaeon]